MTMTDPIADMLSRIRNAARAAHEDVLIPSSKIKENIAKILVEEGYALSYKVAGIRRVSKPGRRVYKGAEELPRVLGGLGVAIISTSAGVMTDKQARQSRVGGEVLAYVW